MGCDSCPKNAAKPTTTVAPQQTQSIPVIGDQVAPQNFSVAAEVSPLLQGADVSVSSILASSSQLSGRIDADAHSDVIGVSRGSDIILLAPVLNGKQVTKEI